MDDNQQQNYLKNKSKNCYNQYQTIRIIYCVILELFTYFVLFFKYLIYEFPTKDRS